MQDTRYVFFGTPDIAVTVLEKLKEAGLLPSLVVTAPDRPSGRGMKLTPPPVKVWADENNIPTLQPEKLDEAFVNQIKEESWDLFVVFAYSALLKRAVLDIPKHGTINLHPSLLPKLRGPSPIVSAILTDQKTTGVTVMLIDEKMDHGPILAQQEVAVDEWPPRVSELQAMLMEVGGALLADTIPKFVRGGIDPQEQDHNSATFCHMLKKEDGRIDLNDDPYQNLLKIRAYETWPRAHFFNDNGKRVTVLSAHLQEGALVIDEVIPEGRGKMLYEDFLRS